MIFQRFFNFCASRFDELIDEKRHINDILNEQYLLQDLQGQQSQHKILNYITEHTEYLEILIGYVIGHCEPNEITEASYKYPFIASEILSKESDQFYDFLFEPENKQYLEKLFELIQEDTLEITQASYFCKILQQLLRKRYEQTINFIDSRKVSDLMKHIDINQIAEVIEKLILPENYYPDNFDKQKPLLKRVMNVALNKYYENDIFDNCMQIINNVLKNGFQESTSTLLQQLFEPNFFLSISYQSSKSAAYELIVNLLTILKNNEKMASYQIFNEVAKYLPHVFQSQNILTKQIQTTYGAQITPLNGKVILFQIYYLLLESEVQEIIEILRDNDCLSVVTQLVITNQFNNQIQIWFQKIVYIILDKLPSMHSYAIPIIKECLIKYNINQTIQVGGMKHKIKPGYQGIFTNIANYLNNKQFEVDPLFQEYTKQIIQPINTIEYAFLCNIDPKPKPHQFMNQFEPINRNYGIFLHYLIVQYNQNIHNDNDNQNENDNANDDNYDNDNDDDLENDNDDNDEFQDCIDIEQSEYFYQSYQRNEEKENRKKSEDEQIEEYLTSPETNVHNVAQLIEQELKLDSTQNAEELEKMTEHQVNEYWKTHEDQLTE